MMKRLLTLLAVLSLTLLIGGCETIATRSSAGYLPANGDNNCKIFTNSIENKSIQWIGQCAEGFVDGYGVADHYVNGYRQITVKGIFLNGKISGQGRAKYADGEEYIGEFKDGKRHGKGVLNRINYTKYEGEFKDGEPNGHGIESYYNRFSVGDKIDRQYVGAFKNGKPSGLGILSSFDGKLRKEGLWINGEFVRSEKVVFPIVNHQTDTAIYAEKSESDSYKQAQTRLSLCPPVDYTKSTHDERVAKWHNCFGRYVFELNDDNKGNVYEGTFEYGLQNGRGTLNYVKGGSYVGNWKDGKMHGQGKITTVLGSVFREGIWENGKFVRDEKVNLLTVDQQKTDVVINGEHRRLDSDLQTLRQERSRREQERQSSKLSLQTTTTNPDANGVVIISVRTNADTSSLKVNGEEQGGRPDGNYVIKKVARVGQDTQFTVVATDISGNTDSKTIIVSRNTVESAAVTASLNPENIKTKSSRDAVAVIIGISNYKSLPRADFAKDDAQVFYDYAIRALGVKPENIKLILDAEAEEVEIFKAFKTWLPARVKSTTDVFVFYSGHGLPTPDGLGLYLLPYRADRDLISKTAVQFQEISMDIQAAKPKSVTIFMDACYSGQARGGETLIASARPLALKAQMTIFPNGFNVFSASQSDQISSSSPELKHGIFSFFLMKGMEGDADANRDGKITLGEMQGYLAENVGRQAGMMNRKQEPQLIGDPSRVLVGR